MNASRRARLKLLKSSATVFALISAVSGVAHAEITVKPTAKGYDIDITSEATASELVDAIANAAGVDIKGEPAESTIGTNHLRNASLERALRQLLPKAHFVVRSDSDETPTEIIFLPDQQGADAGSDEAADPGDGSFGSDDPSSDPAALLPDAGMGTAPITPPPADPTDTDPMDTGQ